MKKNYIELFKVGKFYSAYGDNGIILHNLLGYKYLTYKNSLDFLKMFRKSKDNFNE